jgi:hypothetical protein
VLPLLRKLTISDFIATVNTSRICLCLTKGGYFAKKEEEIWRRLARPLLISQSSCPAVAEFMVLFWISMYINIRHFSSLIALEREWLWPILLYNSNPTKRTRCRNNFLWLYKYRICSRPIQITLRWIDSLDPVHKTRHRSSIQPSYIMPSIRAFLFFTRGHVG